MNSSNTVGRHQLIETLRACEQPFHLHATADASELLLLRHGGRVLGLFAPGQDENFLWANPAFASPETARALFAASGWHNTGGDRMWVTPEIDFFFPRFPDTSVHICPESLDPGRYKIHHDVDSESASPRLINTLALTLSRSGVDVTLRTDTHWTTVGPIVDSELLQSGQLTCAGYSQVTTLAILASTGPCAIGLWDILQVPPGGECLVQTRRPARAKQYVGRTAESELRIHERAAVYHPSTPGINKIGFLAPELTGRIGYFHGTGDQVTLVVRQFTVDSSAAYVDVPWQTAADLEGAGCAAQICAVDHPVLGRYVELEHHSPAIDCARSTHLTDISHLWAIRGAEPDVRAVARQVFDWVPVSDTERMTGRGRGHD
jgi:hypothetical protein